jgi:hypothetical protein
MANHSARRSSVAHVKMANSGGRKSRLNASGPDSPKSISERNPAMRVKKSPRMKKLGQLK